MRDGENASLGAGRAARQEWIRRMRRIHSR